LQSPSLQSWLPGKASAKTRPGLAALKRTLIVAVFIGNVLCATQFRICSLLQITVDGCSIPENPE
jgi:hypothetical protein